MAYEIVPTEQINCDRQILLRHRIISIMMDYPMCKTVGEGGKASVMNDRRNSLVNPAAKLVAVAASVSVVTAAMGNIRK